MIELENIKKVYKSPTGIKTVLNKASLSINEGDFITITGANGSGKTTLLNIISGLLMPDEGKYIYAGERMLNSPKDLLDFRRTDIGYVTQKSFFIEKRTVFDNISLPLEIRHKKVVPECFNSLAEKIGIAQLLEKKVGTLSAGERQKVSIMRALITNPRLLLLDEPTSSIDKASRSIVADLFSEYNRNGTTIVLATHDCELEKFGQYHYLMSQGVLAPQEGTI
jgi:ABC-type lipoprotein export system ATPase subunit